MPPDTSRRKAKAKSSDNNKSMDFLSGIMNEMDKLPTKRAKPNF